MNHKEVMRQALEALKNVRLEDLTQQELAIEALRAALAEPEPEPVAIALNDGTRLAVKWITRNVDDGTPLYAAPPQRKPLPLTDEECIALLKFGNYSVAMVRAVERAHGIE